MNYFYTTLLILTLPLFVFGQNVGVGTTNPQSKLDVNGGLTIGSSYSGVNSAPTDGAIIEGNVGIGITSPSAKLHVFDTTGYAILAEGEIDLRGAIRNEGTEYGGGIAINDGLTVGTISGGTCTPDRPTTMSFSHIIGGYLYFWGQSQIYDNYTYVDSLNPIDTGACREVTNLYFEVSYFDSRNFPIDVDIYVRGEYIFSLYTANADDLTWTLGQNYSGFNGDNPDSVNWSTYCINYLPDTDYWESYSGVISYDWGVNSNVPLFAAFGEIRASSTLFANSTSAYGDLAEYFKIEAATRKPEPGDIVSISRDNPQSFELTNTVSDPLLAGVISKDPSLLLNNPNEGEPIALSGRVQVKVNTNGGIIRPGDAITSSNVMGIGQKADASGMILGHALESFDGARTNQGKIWILLAKGHYQNAADNNIEIVQGTSSNLGGVEVNGFQKTTKEKVIFVEWNDVVKSRINTGIEFDDLTIDIDAVGGYANLSVASVDANGFTVNIKKADSDFKGFYYSVNFVSTALANPVVYEEKEVVVSNATIRSSRKVYADRNAVMTELISKSGKSTLNMPQGLTGNEVKAYKQDVLNSWKKADSKLFTSYKELGNILQARINTYPELMGLLRTN